MTAEILRLLQASSCFRGEVCASLPCACAETLAALTRHAQCAPKSLTLTDITIHNNEVAQSVAQRAPDQTLREFIEFWSDRMRLVTFEDRERFREVAHAALTSTERCDGADDLEHLDGMLDDRERG